MSPGAKQVWRDLLFAFLCLLAVGGLVQGSLLDVLLWGGLAYWAYPHSKPGARK